MVSNVTVGRGAMGTVQIGVPGGPGGGPGIIQPPGGGPPPGGPPPGGGFQGPPGGGAPGFATVSVAVENRLALGSGDDVASIVGNASGLVLRGFEPASASNSVLLDGVEVPMLLHAGGLRPILYTASTGSTESFSAGFPVEYGRATGSLLGITSRSDIPERATGMLDVGAADATAALRAPLSKEMSVEAGGQFSYLDRLLNAAVPARDPVALSPLPRYWDAHAQWLWSPVPELRLKVFGLAARDRMIDWFDSGRTGAITRDTEFHRGLVEASWQPSSDLDFHLVAGGGLDHFRHSSFDVRDEKFQVRSSASFRRDDTFRTTWGIDYTLERPKGWIDASVAPYGARVFSATELSRRPLSSIAGHVEASWHPSPELEIVPGLRAESFGTTQALYLDPRLLVRYRLDDQGQFIAKGSFGLYHQGSSFLQADARIGNPDLLPQFSRQYTAGIELRPQRETLIDLSFFYADRTGVIVPTGTSEVFSNSGVGFTNGLQFVVQQKLLQGLEGWLSYSLSRSELAASTIAASYPSPYDQTHVFALALSYLLPGGMKLSGRWQYASGTPTTAVNGSVYDASGNV
jgi:hypothetical protein